MKKMSLLAPLAALCLASSPAMATYMADISYTATDNGSGNYTFNFTVENNSTDADTGGLDFFLIDFDADPNDTLYSNITWLADNGWDSDAFDDDDGFGGLPGGVLADDGIPFGGSGGIAQGASLGGFQVNFDYAGALPMSDQLFSFLADFGASDADNGGIEMDGYWILAEVYGTTIYTAPPQPPQGGSVPEPGVILLMGAGLLGMFGTSRRKRG